MKTPEEIKLGLECCYGDSDRRHCEKCPHGRGGITMYLDVWQVWLMIVCCVSGGAAVGFIVAALLAAAKG